MNTVDFYTKLSIEIYQNPLSDLRINGYLKNAKNPLSNLILVIDFDTERMMNGILGFIGNSTGIYSRETVTAMNDLGAKIQGINLNKILDIADRHGMNYSSIQNDMKDCKSGETTSWDKLHDNKWKLAEDQIITIFDKTDWDALYDKMLEYIGANIKFLSSEVPKYMADFKIK